VSSAADELYGLPLEEFTNARNELERRLRKEGNRDEAQAVKALRKPTAAAWALNQVARRRKAAIERLLAAGGRLRRAQEELLAGGDRADLDEAAAEEQELVARLARDATAVAAEAGVGSTAALEEKLRATLHAAAVEEETAEQLTAGRLVRERRAVGVVGFEPMPAAQRAATERPAEPARARREAERRDQRRELERRLKATRSAEAKARRRMEAAERAAASARERAANAAERLRGAEQDQDSARAELNSLANEVDRVERELERLRRGR